MDNFEKNKGRASARESVFPKSRSEVLQERNCIGLVAEFDSQVVGFMVYEANRKSLQLINFAVLPEMRMKSFGTQMMNTLKGKLSQHRRTVIRIDIRESNLAGQLFLKRSGFRAITLIREHFSNLDSVYEFEYRFDGKRMPFAVSDYVAGDSVRSDERW